MKKALIAMSGGIDSSMAAYFMKEKGYSCIGCTMKLYENDPDKTFTKTCCSLSDVEDARSVAYSLGMPYYVFNFTDAFREKIIKKFIQSYEAGRTPNPCIDCNRYMKFEKLFERSRVLGCDCIVTGHYARIEYDGDLYRLKKGVDKTKDQSYVLYAFTQEQLSHTILPLGNMTKSDIRMKAEELGFVNAGKPDSQDICFVPDGDYAGFLSRNSSKKIEKGSFIDINGNVIGTHNGIVHYTVGQRKGLGTAFGKPMYVKSINPADNTVTLGENKDLFTSELIADEFNWISGRAPGKEFRCCAKIRYRHTEQPARVIPLSDDSVKIIFDTPQRAITGGQAAVLYDGDEVLGGGIIR